MSFEEKKDAELSNEVKSMYDDMHAPDTWKQETLLKMQEEALRVESEKKVQKADSNMKKKKVTPFHLIAATAGLCAAAICLFLILPKGASYVTPMEDGAYYDTVELKDGEIHFVSNRVAISISPNAGNAFDTKEETEENTAEVLLAQSGGMITFEKTGNQKLPQIAEDSWSYIGEQKIYVTVLKKDEIRYQAVYEKGGETYEVIGEGVTQKEFIDELYDRITE